jgi:hypothetical protein
VEQGLVELSAGAFKLTEAGQARSLEVLSKERDAWGASNATAALDAFLDIDHRVKDVVTAWQMRDPQTPNDHTDADYDVGVPGAPRAVHDDATAWLRPIEPTDRSLPRLRVAAQSGVPGGEGRRRAATSRHRGSTATTASGSSCTRT